MPRDLFGNVTRPSISICNRKWYTVPVSLLSHALVIATIVIVPILAAPMMPGVFNDVMPDYMPTVMPPTPAAPPKRAELKPIENPNAAPIVTPDGIKPETPIQIVEISGTEVGVIGGVDNIDTVIAPLPDVVKPEPRQEPVIVGGTIEINGTFYSLQRPAYFARWRDATPDDFVFSLNLKTFFLFGNTQHFAGCVVQPS